ncbi:PAS domain-containing protein (plasmid) [Hymenobacter tibetensis]|uniref:histidine kinase n=1 Tax=Hymenobacter tibetensis TaxID=497967 RepID=A0ABY4D7T7_9BACT|nr:PAS domain-containing protein [Hymenobacter tibetensis]UOG77306.1 PAS domain-containing protein [Hymenobacter tibetensis]
MPTSSPEVQFERLQSAVDAAGTGTWDFTPLTGALIWSDRCKEIFGFALEQDVTYAQFLEGVHPDDRALTQAAVDQALSPTGPGTYAIDYRTQWQDPATPARWAHATGRAFFNAERTQAQRFIGTITDITEQKVNQQLLRQHEAELATMADSIAQLAWIADATGNITWYNQRWYEYTGTTAEQMLGWGWQQVQHPEYVHGVVERLRQAFAAGTAWEDTFPLRGQDGVYRWFLSRAVPLRDEHGHVLRWFGTNTDVTQMRQLQEQLTQAYEDLEVKVTFRTLQLEHEVQQLRAQLAAGVSTPLVPPTPLQ